MYISLFKLPYPKPKPAQKKKKKKKRKKKKPIDDDPEHQTVQEVLNTEVHEKRHMQRGCIVYRLI